MIVVEGPDGGGKSTLVSRLVEDLHIPVAPRVVSKDAEAMVDLKAWVEENVRKGFHTQLYDRHRLISEPIYGSILRDEFQPGFGDRAWLAEMNLRFYSQCSPIIIYCLPSYDVIRHNIADDPDNRVVWADIRRIYSLYVSKFAADAATYMFNTFIYDYTEAYDRHYEMVVDLIKERLGRARTN